MGQMKRKYGVTSIVNIPHFENLLEKGVLKNSLREVHGA